MSNLLPFNSTIINELFKPMPPEDEPDLVSGFYLVLQGYALVVLKGVELTLLLSEFLPVGADLENKKIRIGFWEGKPLWAIQVSPDLILPPEYEALPFQGADTRLDNKLATIAGRAAQIIYWEERSHFCSHCGGALVRIQECWGKRCPSCSSEHYPHIHPCIIVLVRRDKELLLIRNAAWGVGRFSMVAGFIEFGESLEECVEREVFEETGIEVTNIRYVGSQSWPFPSQLMIGFTADYAGGEVAADGIEVVEAGWFHEDNLPVSPGGKRSIARWIFETYGKSTNE
ncbi:MAG: NAD(+) diphosphatase [Desulfuromonadaceae bacterium]|nr:NAD(+) diphosphatase [Desulfuromonadaceae bacterium]MDD2854827.1 NAD(+) diphosphatase [Desulfuromonadaceae bacterium]